MKRRCSRRAGQLRHGVLLPPLPAALCPGHHQNGQGAQSLSLTPPRFPGICGRLLCCLSYEQANYDAFHRSCPKLGKRYQTDQGPMRVLRGNMFRNSVVVLPDGGQETGMTLDEWQAIHPHRAGTSRPGPAQGNPAEYGIHGGQSLPGYSGRRSPPNWARSLTSLRTPVSGARAGTPPPWRRARFPANSIKNANADPTDRVTGPARVPARPRTV